MTRPSDPKLSLLTVQEALRRSRVGEALRPVVKRSQRLEVFTRRLMTHREGPVAPPGRRTVEGDRKALPLQLLARRDRVVVFEASKRALSRRVRELQAAMSVAPRRALLGEVELSGSQRGGR